MVLSDASWARGVWSVEARYEQLLRMMDGWMTTTEAEHQVKGGLLLDVVFSEGAAISRDERIGVVWSLNSANLQR